MIFQRNCVLLVLGMMWLSGCILPPRGVDWPEPRPLDDIAEHKVQVNQVGYFPGRIKIATVTSDSAKPLPWQLLQGEKVVLEGDTTPFGMDADSGDSVHLIDFSAHQQTGEGYTVRAGGHQSLSFAIKGDLYRGLRRDALRYFYLNRSGIPLEMPYVEDKKLRRPAGHVTDRSAPCEPGQRCAYRKDVSGGWYDAGDYGKYVVNGGLSVWLLMHTYEWLYQHGDAKKQPVDMNIPESDNDMPDILDEARFEMVWMLKMQVDEGEEEGLVHHRVRNANFTMMGKAPPTENVDPPRYLRDTTTAATLNLAAAGALCARVYKEFDPTLSAQCLDAAKKAWTAARQNPDLTATGHGHVPYQNPVVDDDFYWAAAELYVTTGDAEYWKFITASKFYGKPNQNSGGSASIFNWQQTDGLGTIALATTSRELPDGATPHREAILQFADRAMGLIDDQGYRFPMDKRSYPWGSNSFILNNALVLALAHDFTDDERYLDGAVLAMDYILGRNPLDFSYVSSYGHNTMQFPHHRFFCPAYDNRLPFPPPGSLAGGPNPQLQDKAVKAYRTGCPPAKCYVDSVESFSSNEVAINWNAALAWVAAWLDERAN